MSLSTSRVLTRTLKSAQNSLTPKSITTCRDNCNYAWSSACPTKTAQLRIVPKDVSRNRFYSSSSTAKPVVLTDPDRPDMFYHLLEPPTHVSRTQPVFGVSFVDILPTGASRAESSRIVGYLPTGGPGVEGEGDEAGLNDFKENPRFREVLHKAVQEGLRDGVDEIQKNGALQLQQGWMHIHDERNIPPLGRIGDPDDILATVLVEDGKIMADTYQPMPSYRMCTSDGVLKLTDGLANKLKEVLLRQS